MSLGLYSHYICATDDMVMKQECDENMYITARGNLSTAPFYISTLLLPPICYIPDLLLGEQIGVGAVTH